MPDLKDELAALRIEREPARTTDRRWVKWVVLLIVLGAGGYAGWRWATRERPIEVETAAVSERAAGTQAAVLNASGYVTARRRATVSSKITGKVVEVNVEEGMAVKEGQILARLDDATPRAAVALAEAQAEAARRGVRENEVRLEEAKLRVGRLTRLVKEGFSTPAEVDAAQAEVDSFDARITSAREQVRVAEAQVAFERTNLDDTIIRAPFSGMAISKDAQPGEMVSPVSAGGGFTRTGISTIVDMRSLEIEVDVNESYINRVKTSQGVTAVLDAYPDWQIPAHVITTVPTADRQKATVLVRIGFAELDPRILPDMGVKVTFLRDDDSTDQPAARAVALVPKAAIRADGNQSYAFVVVNGVVDRRAVTTGGIDGDRIEVLAGLASGERVIVSPPPDLASGATVVER
jgi:RND family efflux transporter MFP subunit